MSFGTVSLIVVLVTLQIQSLIVEDVLPFGPQPDTGVIVLLQVVELDATKLLGICTVRYIIPL